MTSRILSILLALAAGIACSSTTQVNASCIVGSKRSCDFGPECAIGLQECGSDPPAWGACLCTLQEPPKLDASIPVAEAAPKLLGQVCRKNADCASGAFCLLRSSSDLFGGGPPKGVCVADCSAGPAACEKFPGATCVAVAEPRSTTPGGSDAGRAPLDAGSNRAADASRDASADARIHASRDASADAPSISAPESGAPTGADGSSKADGGRTAAPTALCFKSCSLGRDSNPKCLGVPHVACDTLPSGSGHDGFCRPICATNADCSGSPALDGPARICDVRRGVCVDAPSGSGAALGTACDPATTNACSGACVVVSRGTELAKVDTGDAAGDPEATVCSHRCLIGDPVDCGGSKTALGALGALGAFEGACLSMPEGRGPGDVGYCRKLCDCSKDCPLDANKRPEQCLPFEDRVIAGSFGRSGVCMPAPLATGTPITCPAGPDR